MGWYIGIDFHWKQTTLCILDANGRRALVLNIRGGMLKVFDWLAAKQTRYPGSWSICFEASTGYGAIYERLTPLAERVLVAHPGQLRLIFRSKRKNDRVDAEKLAKLLYLGEVPCVHVPATDVRAWRETIRYRVKLVPERTRIKNQIRAWLRGQVMVAPRGLWGRKGLAWLRGLSWAQPLLALRRDLLLDSLDAVAVRIKRLEKALNQQGSAHAGVVLLMTIPGVGMRTAEAMVAYLDDPKRFLRNKCVGSYFGLVPRQDASGSLNRLGHITREGPALVRPLLVQATWQGLRRSPTLKAYCARIAQGNPERQKIAVVATAHYLVRVMHAMLRSGECWRETA